MKSKTFRFVLGLLALVSAPSFANRWIASGGLGLTVNPTLVMLNPQLAYTYRPNLYFGPMIQAGLGTPTIFTFSGTVRYIIGNDPKLKPNIEGGLGLAVGSSTASSVGIHIMFGMGVDYVIDSRLRLGTVVRANLAPPMDDFFLSWPIIIARYYL